MMLVSCSRLGGRIMYKVFFSGEGARYLYVSTNCFQSSMVCVGSEFLVCVAGGKVCLSPICSSYLVLDLAERMSGAIW